MNIKWFCAAEKHVQKVKLFLWYSWGVLNVPFGYNSWVKS